ncbi:MAG: flagellar export protein FliJ [Comamonadaceae bacterium]|nr:MAG: flagellar export protein FliJ [Comamonadaceae bacterium]
MPHTGAMHLAIELAAGRRDALAQQLALARRQWTAAQQQLDQLDSYASEKTQRWAAQAGSCAPEIMHHHYQFMHRLVQAIALQTGVVAEQAGHVARHAQAVREAEARVQVLQQLQAERDRERLMLLQRREQKQSDEMAAALHRRRRDTGHAGALS